MGAGLEVDDIHPFAAAAPGAELVLGQQSLKIPRQIGAGGGKLQMVALLGIGDGAAAQKSRPHIGADAAGGADECRVDLQTGFGAGGAEQSVHLGHRTGLVDLEFIDGAAGVFPAADLPLDAAAGKALLGIEGCLLLLGLDHQTPGVEMFGKTGQPIAGRPDVALTGQCAPGDLAPGPGSKAHALVYSFVSVQRAASRCWMLTA